MARADARALVLAPVICERAAARRRVGTGFGRIVQCATYHAVLHQLGLSAVENGAALMVAKRIVELAATGERDPEGLTAATLEAISR